MEKINIEGTDDMILGGGVNGEHFVGYHGRGNRARFSVEWSTNWRGRILCAPDCNSYCESVLL
jgi:hypothetical protein